MPWGVTTVDEHEVVGAVRAPQSPGGVGWREPNRHLNVAARFGRNVARELRPDVVAPTFLWLVLSRE